jgi:hypothetical protein
MLELPLPDTTWYTQDDVSRLGGLVHSLFSRSAWPPNTLLTAKFRGQYCDAEAVL